MNKLIEIAKANGAWIGEGHVTQVIIKGTVCMTEDQLRATVEQVCAPLLIALEAADVWIDTLPVPTSSATRMGILVTDALTQYRALIGDKE